MRDKVRGFVYLNTKRYISLADLKKFKWISFFISLIVFFICSRSIDVNGADWESMFPIVSIVIWNVLYWKFVYEIKSRKTTFELRFLANGLWGVFLSSLLWIFFTTFIWDDDSTIAGKELCLWLVFVYLAFTLIYVALIVLGVHSGVFVKVKKFGSTPIVLAIEALLASIVPIAVMLGRLSSKALSQKSVEAQNKDSTVTLIVLSILMAMVNINFVQYYYCKKYGILCDEDGNTRSHYLEP